MEVSLLEQMTLDRDENKEGEGHAGTGRRGVTDGEFGIVLEQ